MKDTVTAILHVDRVAAYRLGATKHGATPITVPLTDLTPDQRAVLAPTPTKVAKGKRGHDLTSASTLGLAQLPTIAEATAETLKVVVDAALTHRAETKEREEQARLETSRFNTAACEAFLANDDDDFLLSQKQTYEHFARPSVWQVDPALAEQVKVKVERLEAEWARRKALEKEATLARERGWAAEKQEREALKARRYAAWVAEIGPAERQRRFAEGLLAEAEMLDAVRDWYFGRIDLPRFTRIKDVEVIEAVPIDLEQRLRGRAGMALTEPPRVVSIRSKPAPYIPVTPQGERLYEIAYLTAVADGVTAAEYAAIEQIRERAKPILEGGDYRLDVCAMEHRAAIRHQHEVIRYQPPIVTSEPLITRRSLKVTLQIDGWSLSREYMLASEK